jgi:hypothetical protein
MAEFPAIRTPLTQADTAQAVRDAYVRVFGSLPSREAAELLTAQVWLENARGKAITANNIGNLSVKPSDGVDYYRPPWFDRAAVEALPESDTRRARYLQLNDRMHAGTAPSAFRAWASPQQGFDEWLGLLKRRYPAILQAADNGDPIAFAQAIYASGYCRDVECAKAGPSYRSLQAEIRKLGYFADLPQKKKEPEPFCLHVHSPDWPLSGSEGGGASP